MKSVGIYGKFPSESAHAAAPFIIYPEYAVFRPNENVVKAQNGPNY
jgi:hypothetical protein